MSDKTVDFKTELWLLELFLWQLLRKLLVGQMLMKQKTAAMCLHCDDSCTTPHIAIFTHPSSISLSPDRLMCQPVRLPRPSHLRSPPPRFISISWHALTISLQPMITMKNQGFSRVCTLPRYEPHLSPRSAKLRACGCGPIMIGCGILCNNNETTNYFWRCSGKSTPLVPRRRGRFRSLAGER
jgi:hypothetical protein